MNFRLMMNHFVPKNKKSKKININKKKYFFFLKIKKQIQNFKTRPKIKIK